MKLKKAMILYPIEVILQREREYQKYRLGNRVIWYSSHRELWASFIFDKGYSSTHEYAKQSEAVAWLIEGAEKKAFEGYKIYDNDKTIFKTIACPFCGKKL